jgi:hypothetical protein
MDIVIWLTNANQRDIDGPVVQLRSEGKGKLPLRLGFRPIANMRKRIVLVIHAGLAILSCPHLAIVGWNDSLTFEGAPSPSGYIVQNKLGSNHRNEQ